MPGRLVTTSSAGHVTHSPNTLLIPGTRSIA
jgi:hypothetical protein